MKNILYILAGLLLPLMAAGANPDDLYSQYKSGADILIGDLVVNKTTYPDAVLVAPAELTFELFAKGGLYFIDDKSGKGISDLAAAPLGKYSAVATDSSPLIVIGRYKNEGKQTEIKVSEMRTRGDVAFMNVKLTATQAAGESSPVFNMFAKNGNDHNSTAIRLQDCSVDNVAARNLVNDVQNPESAPYSKVVIDNCVIELASEKGTYVVALIRSESADVQEPTEFCISNSVIYAAAPAKYATAIHTVKNNPGRVLVLKGNTFVNFGGCQGYIKHGVVASAHIEKNLAAICINKPVDLGYDSAKFVYKTSEDQAKLVSAGNNFFSIYGESVFDSRPFEIGQWELKTGKTDRVRRVDPFKAYSVENGYFPVNPDQVINGAGATYDAKYFISK
jgi:hypothetical protein